MEPVDEGAVAVSVKTPVVLLVRPLESVTVQDNVAPADDGIAPQSTAETPLPGVTAVTTTPEGNFSLIGTDVPDVAVPLLAIVNV